MATYDFADRPAGMTVQRSGQTDQPVVTAAEYLPGGPLASLTLGNGFTEARAFDNRYQPERITLAGGATLLDWDYATDGVGNVLSIADLLDPGGNRTYAYQDVQYFLTEGDGPWGSRAWAYDQIGNRLTETTGAGTDTYVYDLNGGGGNTPVLSEVQLGAGGARDYLYGPAGHLQQVTAGANPVLFTSDDAGRLAHLARPAGGAQTQLRYDGRGFLAQAEVPGQGPIFADGFETGDLGCWSAVAGGAPGNPANCPPPPVEPLAETEPLYSSGGLLHALFHTEAAGQRSRYLFYFAARPVAQLELPAAGGETWTFLTTDHLGTPAAATDLAGALRWEGGFEPFGRDWQEGTPAGASENGLQLRLPGQWHDEAWAESTLGVELYQNVWRWLDPGTGRYTRSDPSIERPLFHSYGYADNRPLFWIDPDGRKPAFPRLPPDEYIPPEVPCIGAYVVRAFLQGSLGPNRNRWAHCYASCGITKCAGTSAAENLGLDKERFDAVLCRILRSFGSTLNTFCNSAFQPSDFEDNERGRSCPADKTCDEQCEPLRGRPDVSPGPLFDLQ